MYSGGNVTIYVSSMDKSVSFYTGVLGLKLVYRFEDNYALIHAGRGLSIGLHPASEQMPAGRPGSMAIGLELDGSIDDAVALLQSRGLTFNGEPQRSKAGAFVGFSDPDGVPLYLAELDMSHVGQGQGDYLHA